MNKHDKKARKGDLAIIEEAYTRTYLRYHTENAVRYRVCVVVKATREGAAIEFADIADDRARQYIAGECGFADGKPHIITWKNARIIKARIASAATMNMHGVARLFATRESVSDDIDELRSALGQFRLAFAN